MVRLGTTRDMDCRGETWNSNHVFMNVVADRLPGRAIIMVSMDNLVKGASGQAIQNMNVMFGLQETQGIDMAPMFP